MTTRNDPESKFTNLLKLTDEEQTGDEPSPLGAKAKTPVTRDAVAPAIKSQRTRSKSPASTQNAAGGSQSVERVNITISPKSELYATLVDVRSALPRAFRSQTLSSLLLRYLAENDKKTAEAVRDFLTD